MGLIYDSASDYMNNAKAAMANANAAMANAQGIAQQGISNANNAASTANGDLSKASGYIGQGVAAYGNMTPYITKVGNQANLVNTTAQSLTPYAAMMKSYAEQLANNSAPLTDYGKGLLGQSNALLNMDGSGGGLVGQYVANLGAYSPDRYVAMAAADVQGSADNAWNQMLRKQARTGQAANGSGNQAALAKEWARDTAALLAGAKTRAWQTGLNEQTAALRGALADALSMGNAGTSAMSAGNTALSSATSAAGSAANVINQKGQLEATAGQLNASAASLTAQQGAGYVSAGNAQTSVANGRISAASLTNSANQAAINAAIAAAQQQGNFASTWANAASKIQEYGQKNANSEGGSSSSMSSSSSEKTVSEKNAEHARTSYWDEGSGKYVQYGSSPTTSNISVSSYGGWTPNYSAIQQAVRDSLISYKYGSARDYSGNVAGNVS